MFEDFRLRVFVTVAGSGNFTVASRELGISQPAVSQNIAELERIIGSKLFDRSRGSVELTEDGKLLMNYATKILFWYQEIDSVMIRKTAAPSEPVLIHIGEGKDAEVSVIDGDISIRVV